MAAKAKLSVLGLYQWNHNIFADMALPEEVDGDVLTWRILEDCAELEVLYSDPDYMRASIYNWSSAMLPNWQKMVDALTAEYNPIWNKDGTIKEKRTYGQQQESRNYGQTQETALYGADTTTTTIGPRSAETTHQVSGFNETGLSNASKDSSSSLQAIDTEARQSHTDTLTGSAHNDTATKQSYIDQVEITEQGNIGVTESSAMVRHEVELRSEFNIYSIIVNDFKKHYCLMVY